MTKLPTLCVLQYNQYIRDCSTNNAPPPPSPPPPPRLRLPGPRRPRTRTLPRSNQTTDPEETGDALLPLQVQVPVRRDLSDRRLEFEYLSSGERRFVEDAEDMTRLTTPYRYSSSKSSSLQALKVDNLYSVQGSVTVPDLYRNRYHYRSHSEPPPNVDDRRSRTSPANAFSLPVLKQGGAGQTSISVNAELLQDPRWNEYLKAWVSGKQMSSRAYVSFVAAMSLKDKGRYQYVREFEELPAIPCERFFQHMQQSRTPKPQCKTRAKELKRPEFWTWKGRRVSEKQAAKSKHLKRTVRLCNSLEAVHLTQPATSTQPLTVAIPSCSIASSVDSLSSSPTSDLCPLTPTSSPYGLAPDSYPEEGLSEIDESSYPSGYGSITSELIDRDPVCVPALQLHKLEKPPQSPSTIDWDMHSYLDGFGTGDAGTDGLGLTPLSQMMDDTAGPLVPSKVDQSQYMYNNHTLVLETVAYETYLPLDDPSDLIRSHAAEECTRSMIDPPESPLRRPGTADVDEVAIYPSSILTRPDLPSRPPSPEESEHSSSPSPKEPSPYPKSPTHPPRPLQTPTPPLVQKPAKKRTKMKRPVKKEIKDKISKKRPVAKQTTPVPVTESVGSFSPQKTPTPETEMVPVETKPEPVETEPELVETEPEPVEIEPVQTEAELEPVQHVLVSGISPLFSEEDPEPETQLEEEAQPDDISEPISPEPSETATTESPVSESPTLEPLPATTPSPLPLPRSPLQKDMTLAIEIERQRLAEERQRKAMLMYEKLRSRHPLHFTQTQETDMTMEYGWLAQYCILKPEKVKMYSLAFETVDENHRGWLSCIDTLIALKGITGTQDLTEKEEEYICRILEIADYDILAGCDFRLFSVIAALSQRLTSIDNWVRNLIQKFDLQMLDWKMHHAKELFQWCLDEATGRLSIAHLLIELRAGGVGDRHLAEVRERFGGDGGGTLDLLDFLSYLPLFILAHKSVMSNPLSDVRDK